MTQNRFLLSLQRRYQTFCRFLSSCLTAADNLSVGEVADGGNLRDRGMKNPYLEANVWGPQIDPEGLRVTLDYLYEPH